jgi:hypothetical protein
MHFLNTFYAYYIYRKQYQLILFHVAVDIPQEVDRLVNLQRLVSYKKFPSVEFTIDYLIRDMLLRVMVFFLVMFLSVFVGLG